jgi:uncharacterized protein (TIGR03084 family)
MDFIDDFQKECEALRTLVESVDEEGWAASTIFHGWTIYDEIVHNHFLDLLAIEAITAPDDFALTGREVMQRSRTDPDYSFRAYTNDRLGILSRDDVLVRWTATYNELAALIATRDPLEKMPWFGPPMTMESCAGARQMETWAHGQDIWDLVHRRRENTDRIRSIAMLGIKTFGWSFANRKLDLPTVKPFVVLTAPSGAEWCWNDPQSPEQVSGPAEDFCLIVTQRRHVDDTRLSVQGQGARAWLEIAQCFAGDPADGPAPGARVVRFDNGTSL